MQHLLWLVHFKVLYPAAANFAIEKQLALHPSLLRYHNPIHLLPGLLKCLVDSLGGRHALPATPSPPPNLRRSPLNPNNHNPLLMPGSRRWASRTCEAMIG